MHGVSPGAIYPTDPFIATKLADMEIKSVDSERNFASPKSLTWAVMSTSRRMLLGLRSQCTIGTGP